MNWLQLIERRRSVRQFESGMDGATIARVTGICQGEESFNSSLLELRLLPGAKAKAAVGSFLGFGRVLAPWYIAAIAPADKDSLLNLGYCTQRALLEMTALDLGTCWLGHLANRERYAADLGLEEGLGVRALVAWGRPRVKSNSLLSGKRVLPGKLAVFDDNCRDSMPWRAVLEAVRWAPSAINRQPWRLWFTTEAVHLYSTSKLLARGYTPIEMGIAFCHIELACKQLAIPGKIMIADHPLRRGWEYWASFVRD